jgi:hypothetical protein
MAEQLQRYSKNKFKVLRMIARQSRGQRLGPRAHNLLEKCLLMCISHSRLNYTVHGIKRNS